VGFATTGMLCTADSAGLLRGLAEKQDWQWVPMLDMVPLRKTKDDSHWLVGVTEEDVKCVLLKQGATEPHVHPRPLLESVPIEIPLLQPEPEFHSLERLMFRRKMAIEQEALEMQTTGIDTGVQAAQSHEMDRELLQMIHHAMKADKEARALEIGMLFSSAKALQNAIQLAHVSQMQSLAERLTMIAQAKFSRTQPSQKRRREVQFQEDEQEEEEEAEAEGEEAEGEEEVQEEDAMDAESDGSQLPPRQHLSPVPPASRGSPVKRVRIDESPAAEEENQPEQLEEKTGKQDRLHKASGDSANSQRGLFNQPGNPFSSNPFAKSVSTKAQPKSLSSSLSSLAASKSALQGTGLANKLGAKAATKRPIGKTTSKKLSGR